MDWLHVTFTVGEKLIWDDWTFFRTDYLELLYELADVVEDISSIVELYAESTLALLDTVSPPEASHSTIKLSSTEYNRIASALCLLRINRRFLSFGGTLEKFREIVPEWQTEQILTVETFLRDVGRPTRSPLYYLVDAKYRCGNVLREPSYHTWSPYVHGLWVVGWMPGRLAGMNPYNLSASRYFANIVARPPFPNDEERVTEVVERLPNYARNNIERITADVGLLPYYKQIFIQLGLFFWDDDRFVHLPMTDADEYEALIERYEDACDRGIAKAYDSIYREESVAGYYSDKVLGYRVRPEYLKKWTRSPVQCTFGEWMARNYDDHYNCLVDRCMARRFGFL